MSLSQLLRRMALLENQARRLFHDANAIHPPLQEQPQRPVLAFRDFCSEFLTVQRQDNEVVPLKPESALHELLVQRLEAITTTRPAHLNILAPRASAKSTWSTFAYPLWSAYHRLDRYIVLIADSGEQAEKYLDGIRSEVETNGALRQAYPDVGKASVWRANAIEFSNGVRVEAMGTGGKIRGRKHGSRRPDLIIVDDPQNIEHVASDVRRERSWQWLNRDVCNAGSPSTNIVVLGTALHRKCVVCQLQETAGWETHVFRSIMEWPKRMDLWSKWEEILLNHQDKQREAKALAFYEKNRVAMHE